MSNGAKRFFLVLAVVLFALALPVFGANGWWHVLRSVGVPTGAPLGAAVGLIALLFFLFVYYVGNKVNGAVASGFRALRGQKK